MNWEDLMKESQLYLIIVAIGIIGLNIVCVRLSKPSHSVSYNEAIKHCALLNSESERNNCRVTVTNFYLNKSGTSLK